MTQPEEADQSDPTLLGVVALLVIVTCCSGAIGGLIRPWRGLAVLVATFGVGLTVGLVTYGAGRSLRRARPALTAAAPARFAFPAVVGLAALLGPAAAVTTLFTRGWTLPLTIAGAGLLIAAILGVATMIVNNGIGPAATAVAAGVALLGLTAACVFGIRAAVHDPLAGQGQPVDARASQYPGLINPTPTWSPSPNAPPDPETTIRYEVERRTLQAAGSYRPMTTTCSIFARICTVTYGGVDVEWQLNYHEVAPTLAEYDPKADKLAMTRQGVHAWLAYHYRGARTLRCDPLPDVFLAPVRKPYTKHCYVEQERFDDTRKVDILAHEGGVSFQDTK